MTSTTFQRTLLRVSSLFLAAGYLCMTPLSHAATPPLSPPSAPREPKDVSVHGDKRIDDYFWLRNKEDPRTLPYLKAENAYADAWFAPHAALKEKLYQEMLGRIQQDDDSVPYRKGDWWYSTKTMQGEQYPRHLRRHAAGTDRAFDSRAKDETLLDLNAEAKGQPFTRLGDAAMSPDAVRLAYSIDHTGGLDYVLRVKEVAAGAVDPWQVEQASSVAWGSDSRTLYYVTMDASKRSNRLWRHVIGAAGADTLLYEEKDEQFDIGVGATRDQKYVLLTSMSKDSSEVSAIDAAATPQSFALRTIFPRKANVEYHVDHRAGAFYVRINDTGRNFRLVKVDAAKPDLARAEELIAARNDVSLDDVDAFAHHLVVTERVTGNLQLRIVDLERPAGSHAIAFDEAAYSVNATGNAEFETGTLRFVYTSLTTPASTYDYDLASRERVLKKRQPVPGYDPALYASERITAKANDGTEVPISLVWRRDMKRPGPQPLLLYGYGSYGIPMDATFSQSRVSLLDRGAVFAIAHIRGGGDQGRTWYEAGKMAKKQTTFTDFVACAEALVGRGITRPEMLAIQGGSAGGLLMGAVVNLRPDLFKAVIAQVPFVDVINTMLDETLPLTVGEFLEWGNPKVAEQYAWMRAYSPYDNLRKAAYPAMLVRTGLNDTQVSYWEPSKYVARLRTLKTDANPLLFKINLSVGHGGASGRFDALREIAEDDVFLLAQFGLPPQ